jgi:outer membrane protein assembly factor BamB
VRIHILSGSVGRVACLKWTYEAGSRCAAAKAATPAIGSDGTICVGVNVSDKGAMLALNSDGTRKWSARYGENPTFPAIDPEGTIYYGGGSGAPNVYALFPDGTLMWEHDTEDGRLRTPIAIGAHHRLYAGTSSKFFAIGP